MDVKASRVESITRLKFEHSAHMAENALHYLNAVNNDEQYPAARCALSKNVYMYQRFSSFAVKSMNRANMAVQEQIAGDVVNSTILLLKLESAQFNENRLRCGSGMNLSPLMVRNYVMMPILSSTIVSTRHPSPNETLFGNVMWLGTAG